MVRRFTSFLVVGTAGFILDFAVMWSMLAVYRLPPMQARLVAFAAAVAFTYALNKAFTFGDRPRRGRLGWLLYALASATAAAVNLGTFAAALAVFDGWVLAPYVAMPIGAAAGLLVNFSAYNFIVFRRNR